VNVLIDTHVLIWYYDNDRRLSKRAIEIIDDTSNRVLVSAATAWEIATKFRIGKLQDARLLVQDLSKLLDAWQFERLPISLDHGHRAGLLEGAHKDPFDRMIAAQAIVEDLSIVTVDPALAALGAKVVW
jgi:PIN domain nuclease of toxin-antitoxin system